MLCLYKTMIYKIHKFFTVHSKLPLLNLVTYYKCKILCNVCRMYAQCTMHTAHRTVHAQYWILFFYFREKIRFNYAHCTHIPPTHAECIWMNEPDTGISSNAFRTCKWAKQNCFGKTHEYENPTAENGKLETGIGTTSSIEWILTKLLLVTPETWNVKGTWNQEHLMWRVRCSFKVFIMFANNFSCSENPEWNEKRNGMLNVEVIVLLLKLKLIAMNIEFDAPRTKSKLFVYFCKAFCNEKVPFN